MEDELNIKSLKGTNDILPEEAESWQELEGIAVKILKIYGYREIRTPLIEEVRLFSRTLGNESNLVKKEMYTFKDQGDREIALRPEGTASVVRAYIEHNLGSQGGIAKLYYMGPMFRGEKPQAGRSRQFHQLGVEAIGSSSPYMDAEVILLLLSILQGLGLEGFALRLNSLGCREDRLKYNAILKESLKNSASAWCEDCRQRLLYNPLRIFDCKKPGCRNQISRLPSIFDSICNDCQIHFKTLSELLDSEKAVYTVDPYLVRGLDYYSSTAFEVTHPALGAQNALAGGGRYDELVTELGGNQPVGALGFAMGMERTILARQSQSVKPAGISSPLVYVAIIGDESQPAGFKLLNRLRKEGIAADADYQEKSIKGQMRSANRAGVRFVIIIGEDELRQGIASVKEMDTGEQWKCRQEELIDRLKEKIKVVKQK